MHLIDFILQGAVQAARSLSNFHWFPPDCLCESGNQPPSIRKDVKYRARRTRIESGGEGGGERRVTLKAGKGQMRRWIREVKQNDKESREWKMAFGQINGVLKSNLKLLYA